MNNNKVIYDGQTIMDISDSTTSSNNLLQGEIGYSGNGDRVVGSATAGHKVVNDSGTDMQRRDKLQFKGVYVEDDQANDVTKVDIVREFQSKAEIEALTGEAKKGFEVIEDNEEYIPYTGSDILFDNTDTSFEGENVQEVLEEVDERYKGVALLSIPANTYNTWTLALQALYVEYNKLTMEQKRRCVIVRSDDIIFKCTAFSSAFSSVYAGSTTKSIIQSLFLQSGIFLQHSIEGSTIATESWSNKAQTYKIELRLY